MVDRIGIQLQHQTDSRDRHGIDFPAKEGKTVIQRIDKTAAASVCLLVAAANLFKLKYFHPEPARYVPSICSPSFPYL